MKVHFKLKYCFAVAILSLLSAANTSHAEVTIFDQNDWKVGFGGFVEFDAIYDTTRSLVETVGSTPIARKGTFDGDNGRTQFSLRNSRLSFNVQAPMVDGWKTRGYIEGDFLGYDPQPSATPPSTSESAFFANPTFRIRHAYVSAEANRLQIIIGQNWSLFGWQPYYFVSTISVNPVTGTLYQRTPRIGAVKTLEVAESNDLSLGLSIERPTQRDGSIPNLVAGARWAMNSRKSGITGPNSDIKAAPMSLGVSGTYRNFSIPSNPTASTSDNTKMSAYGLAINTLVPILASSDGKDVSNTLTASGEFTVGQGYGDEFPSWSGGIGQTFTGTATATTNNQNLDPGLGGFNGNNGFELVKLQTWNAQMQYHLDGKTFITGGYAQVWSRNISDFQVAGAATTNGITAAKLCDRMEAKFVNIGHDFTQSVRAAVEFDQFTTHYVNNGAVNHDNRYMLATYFRF